MFIALAFGYLLGFMTETTNHYPECKAIDFKSDACQTAKKISEFGK